MEQTALSLEAVIAQTVKPLLRIRHLNRDVIIGWIGERGGGKSIGAATTAAIDYGIEGDQIRSNMQITWDIAVGDELAAKYGVTPGSVHYESTELSKHKFLTFSKEYFRSVFVIDEINLWLADARRAMAQQNLLANDVAQQLRKLQSPLFYTCIHEMFVDSRIRDMTDLFIKTEDTALTLDGLRNRQRQGIRFHWILYPMTKKFTGHTYRDNKQAVGPIDFNGKLVWGIIDTLQRQERKKYLDEADEDKALVHITEDPAVFEERNKWGWLYERILALHENGITELEDEQLWRYLQLKERGLSPQYVGRQLKGIGITSRAGRRGHIIYEIDGFDLNKDAEVKEFVLA
ncbi:MAG: hypothetical protein HWN68_17250 [Desulfobacterales bacterium]|nr:hypothetical protein [Desulfobacterales bacterium]